METQTQPPYNLLPQPDVARVAASRLSPPERAIDDLLRESHLTGGDDLPELVARHAEVLGGHQAVMYLVDLQQSHLVPFVPPRPSQDEHLSMLGVDSTIAGRAYQLLQPLTQEGAAGPSGQLRAWLPLINGAERLGVLAVTVESAEVWEADEGLLQLRLQRFASLVAELVVAKTLYGDTIVRRRRTASMGLAAEIQWGVLPPLTFANHAVTLAAALEPAYQVAGDSVDYAVDAEIARFGIFDGMGHGLASAQLASLAVSAYRNARRHGINLLGTVTHIDSAILQMFRGESFVTGVLGELDTTTGAFSWLSAGHLEPVLLRGGRLVRELRSEPALPFGLGDHLATALGPAHLGAEQLQPGDLLLLYTDGVTEARSPDGDFFGLERLVDLVVRNLASGLPAPETMRRVARTLLEHQSSDLTDDATMLLVEWHPTTQPPED